MASDVEVLRRVIGLKWHDLTTYFGDDLDADVVVAVLSAALSAMERVEALEAVAGERLLALEEIRAKAHDFDQLGPPDERRFEEIERIAKEAP
jgi:hypothetical protein